MVIFYGEQWFLQRVIEKVTTEWWKQFILNKKLEISYYCAIWCSATTYQNINSSIVSKGAMNSFKEKFPLARMFPLTAMHTHFLSKWCHYMWTNEIKTKTKLSHVTLKLTMRSILRFNPTNNATVTSQSDVKMKIFFQ